MKIKELTYKQLIGIVVLSAALLLFVLNVKSVIGLVASVVDLCMPLILGIALALFLNVFLRTIENKIINRIPPPPFMNNKAEILCRGGKRVVSIILTLLVVAAIITIISIFIWPSLVSAGKQIFEQAPTAINIIADGADQIFSFFGSALDIRSVMRESLNTLVNESQSFFTIAGNVFSGIANGLFAFVFAIYILAAKEKLKRQLSRLIRAALPEKASAFCIKVCGDASKIFRLFISGQLLEACIIGTLSGLGAFFINPDFAVMLGLIVGAAALIPVLGAFIGIIIGGLLLLPTDPMQALAFVIFIIVLQQFETYFIYPRVVGITIGLPGMWVLFAVLIGGSMGSILGIFIMVPLSAMIYALLREWTNRRCMRGGTHLS